MVGKTLSHYEIVERLGAGGKGEALPLYRDRWQKDPELLDAFDRGLAQSGAEGALRSDPRFDDLARRIGLPE